MNKQNHNPHENIIPGVIGRFNSPGNFQEFVIIDVFAGQATLAYPVWSKKERRFITESCFISVDKLLDKDFFILGK
jgi:hypothetical protein